MKKKDTTSYVRTIGLIESRFDVHIRVGLSLDGNGAQTWLLSFGRRARGVLRHYGFVGPVEGPQLVDPQRFSRPGHTIPVHHQGTSVEETANNPDTL